MSHLPRYTVRPSSLSRYLAWFLFCVVPVSGIIIAAGMANVSAAEKPAVLSAKAKQGETLFKTNCVMCHNKQPGDTTPFGPPNLHGIIGATPPQISAEEASTTIKNGKGVMPPFGAKFSPVEITNLVAYLKAQ